MTRNQRNIAKVLEYCVHKRFSKKELEDNINSLFQSERRIEIAWNCGEDGFLTDHNAMFSTIDTDNKGEFVDREDLRGDFDIYYLECKTPNSFGKEIYVTEVGYDFQS